MKESRIAFTHTYVSITIFVYVRNTLVQCLPSKVRVNVY